MAAKESAGVFKMYAGTDQEFLGACEKGGVKPTRRQFRRWNQKRGTAYANRKQDK